MKNADMKNYIIGYHANCADGQAAGFVAWKATGKIAQTVPLNYDLHKKQVREIVSILTKGMDPTADLKKTTLLIVDFSFPADILEQLGLIFNYIMVLDHHKTFKDDLDSRYICGVLEFDHKTVVNGLSKSVLNCYKVSENVTVRLCMEESGALMVWRFFHPDKEVPDFIRYTSDRDLYKFLDPKTRPFASGMGLHRGKSWLELEEVYNKPQAVIETGEIIEELNTRQIDSILAKPAKLITVQVGGVVSSAVAVGVYNATPGVTSDLLAKYVSVEDNPDIGMTYTISSQNEVLCSLRSLKGVDCSWIATALGGGGHAQACGFSMPLKDFTEVLTSGVLSL